MSPATSSSAQRTLTLSLSPHVCALHTTHTPRLSAFRKSREDETGVSLCPFARVYRRPVCGEVKHGKSYERGVDPLLPQPGLTEVLFVEVTNQTAPTPPPLPPPQPPVIKIPRHRRNRKSIRNHRPAYIRVPAVFLSLFFFFFGFFSPLPVWRRLI